MIGKASEKFMSDMIRFVTNNSSDSKPQTVEGNTVSAIQWIGDNFEDIDKAVKKYLSGYVYRKEDDLIIDFNDGMSIKRVKPMDWILVNADDNDIAVLTNKMFELIWKSLRPEVAQSTKLPASKDEPAVESKDTGVDMTIDNQYGDHIEISCAEGMRGYDKGFLAFDSYYGDHINVTFDDAQEVASIVLKDRYGNKVNVKGSQFKAKSSGTTKTSAQFFEKMYNLVETSKSKTIKQYDHIKDVIEKAQQKST